MRGFTSKHAFHWQRLLYSLVLLGGSSPVGGLTQKDKPRDLGASISSRGYVIAPPGKLARKEVASHVQRGFQTENEVLPMDDGSHVEDLSQTPSLTNKTETTRSSFTLEFRATAIPFVILEASCMFLSSPQSSDGDSERSDLSQLTRLQPLSLQPIRFFGIGLIVLFHVIPAMPWDGLPFPTDVGEQVRRFFQWGDMWVQFFFALSGFVLYLGQNGAPKVPSTAAFITKRAAGIYPSYVISTLLGIAAATEPRKTFNKYISSHLLPGFLMIDSWASPYLDDANMPAWFVCSIFFNWLCFPRWYRLIRNFDGPWTPLLLAWLSTFGLPLVHTARWLHLTWDEPGGGSPPGYFSFFHPLSNWQQFVFGMCLAKMATQVRLESLPLLVRQWAASMAFAAIMVISLFAPLPENSFFSAPLDSTPSPLKLYVHKGPLMLPLFAAILVFVSLGDDVVLQPRALQKSGALWLGKVSVDVYMFSYPVRLFVHKWMNSFGPLSVLVTIFLNLVVAFAFNTFQSRSMDFAVTWNDRLWWTNLAADLGLKPKSSIDL